MAVNFFVMLGVMQMVPDANSKRIADAYQQAYANKAKEKNKQSSNFSSKAKNDATEASKGNVNVQDSLEKLFDNLRDVTFVGSQNCRNIMHALENRTKEEIQIIKEGYKSKSGNKDLATEINKLRFISGEKKDYINTLLGEEPYIKNPKRINYNLEQAVFKLNNELTATIGSDSSVIFNELRAARDLNVTNDLKTKYASLLNNKDLVKTIKEKLDGWERNYALFLIGETKTITADDKKVESVPKTPVTSEKERKTETIASQNVNDTKEAPKQSTREITLEQLTKVINGEIHLQPGDTGEGVKQYQEMLNVVLKWKGQPPITADGKFGDNYESATANATKWFQKNFGLGADLKILLQPKENEHLVEDGKPGIRTMATLQKLIQYINTDKEKIFATNETKALKTELETLVNNKNFFTVTTNILDDDTFKIKAPTWSVGKYLVDMSQKGIDGERMTAINKALTDYKKQAGTALKPEEVLEVIKKIDTTNGDQRNNKKGILFFSAEQWQTSGLKEDSSADEQYAKFISILDGLKKKNANANADALFKAYFEEAEVKK